MQQPRYAGFTKAGAIYPPKYAPRKIAWPESIAPPLPKPTAAISADAQLTDLELSRWAFHPNSAGEGVQVSLDIKTLVRLLTATNSEDERAEWARRLLLVAQERMPDASLKHLWTSLGRESWEAARLRKRREKASPKRKAPTEASTDRALAWRTRGWQG